MDFPLDQLRALSAAVTEGTFEAAARHLHITPSALSQRVKALEESVGLILLQRTKPVRATESGLTLLRLARQFDLLVTDTVAELSGSGPVRVPIAVNADSLETWVLPALATVPGGIGFEIVREDQEHTTALLRDGSVMAAITSTAEPVQGCVVRGLGSMRYRPMASPGFAARWFGDGPTASAYTAAPVVIYDRKDELQDRQLRRRTERVEQPLRHYVPSSAGYADAVRLGLGWGMLPDLQTETDPRLDRLVAIDPGAYLDMPLYWQQWKLDSPALSATAEAIATAAARSLRPARP